MISNLSLTSYLAVQASFLNGRILGESDESEKPPSPIPQMTSPPIPFDPTAEARRVNEAFASMIDAPNVDLNELRQLSWKGIPSKFRAQVWMILVGYVPTSKSRRKETLNRKRKEYSNLVSQHFEPERLQKDPIYRQISIDIPRTCPNVALFKQSVVRESLLRILYCWSIRRPASGYVQGINDLVTPFYDVFLAEHLESAQEAKLTQEILSKLEADCFWCFSKLVDSIQDNYTPNQAGIFRQVSQMRELITRTDHALVEHMDKEGLQFVQFSFRWMNCMLVREFPLHMIIRIWDTYLAEGEGGFSDFHTYVCTAFLSHWSAQLRALDFSDGLLFLQSPPTANWTLKDLEMLLSEAYVWKCLFHDSRQHLKPS